MARFSVSQWIYGREPLVQSLDRLARFGYQAVELAGEPADLDPVAVRGMLGERGLAVSSVCGLYTPERDLSHREEIQRRRAIEYVKR
ncbi:MAG: sugar phosphate isomerase/epimerase, partial [Chloroflexota bacterium]|nr:sugar phosphate isomerase/epimerase [Chloroflexota bacterium]